MSHLDARGGTTRTRTMRSREITLTAAGPGILGSRFESPLPGDSLDVPVAWDKKSELSVVIKNEKGEERSLNDDDYRAGKGKRAVSETGKSDGASSIFLVSDHGFVAAYELFGAKVGSEGPEMPGQIMGVDELRQHLELEQKEGSTIAESVYEKLEKCLVPSMMDSKPESEQEQYLPVDRLYEILDTPTILSLLNERFPDAPHKYLCDIAGPHEGTLRGKCRRRILAILLFCERLDAPALDAFIEGNVWDEDLPLRRRSNNSSGSLSYCSTKTEPNVVNKTLLKTWKRNKLILFYDHQSMFHVPFFDLHEDKLCSYEFQSKVRLPWRSFKKVADGGSGTVYRIEIYPKHHNYGAYSEVRRDLP